MSDNRFESEIARELYRALKAVEFGFDHEKCQACSGWMVSRCGETSYAHTKECPVNIALSKYEGVRVKKIWYKDRGFIKKSLQEAE